MIALEDRAEWIWKILCGSESIDHDSIAAVVDEIKAAIAEAAPRWIPVGERLPDEYENVLVLSSGNDTAVGYRSNDEWNIIGGEFLFGDTVDHWQPKSPLPVD